MILRRASSVADAIRLHRWRNHESTRVMMRRQGPIGWLEHWRWFRDVAWGDGPIKVYMVLDERGRTVGVVSFDVFQTGGKSADMSVTIGPWARGNGYGQKAIALAEAEARRCGVKDLYASIRNGNLASVISFRRCGFERIETSKPDQGFVTLRKSL